MKKSWLLSLGICCLLFVGGVWSRPATKSYILAITSVYSDLGGKSCKTTQHDEESGSITQICSGVGGYKLEVSEGDLRQTVTIIAPNRKKYPLDLTSNVSGGFSSVGQKAEWRVKKQGKQVVPVGLIIRFNASEDPADASKITSYLTVSKITARAACLTNIIKPGPQQNEQAQQAADIAATQPCFKRS